LGKLPPDQNESRNTDMPSAINVTCMQTPQCSLLAYAQHLNEVGFSGHILPGKRIGVG
jgi:hypothetical protein